MERRDFLRTVVAAVSALAAQGNLPLLAAEKGARKKKRPPASAVSVNTFTEPCAIEPVSGYLSGFTPAAGAAMARAFSARYDLVACNGSGVKSRNKVDGTISVLFKDGQCTTVETRGANSVRTTLQLASGSGATSKWTLASSVAGRGDLGFTENGTWDGRAMTVKTKSRSVERAASNPLIARWALLPLVASGRIKKKPLVFDMLDDSTLRPNQTLSYEGEIVVPVKGGEARLDSYVQTGQAIVPTHYLVDGKGLVQLVTMSTVNWALVGPVK